MSGDSWLERPTVASLRYHVPRSQVSEGSGGRQTGNVHLHLPVEPRETRTLATVPGRRATVTRRSGEALCGRDAWYDRDLVSAELGPQDQCPRCVAAARRG